MKNLNILFVCGAGLGSSFAAEMATSDVLKKHDIVANLDHCDISSANSVPSDLIITGENFRPQFEKYDIDQEKIIYLRNIVSKQEIEEKVIPVVNKLIKERN